MMRHKRWIRLREHFYICRHCGTGKENIELGGTWGTVYHTPDGVSRTWRFTPPCQPGPRTAAALAKYAELIAAGGVPKENASC